MRELIREFRYGCRKLLAKPGFTLVAVITLALGIGANTATFSVIDTVLLRPLPYEGSERVTRIFGTVASSGEKKTPASLPDFYDWIEQNNSFEFIAGYVRWNYNVIGTERPERLWGSMSTLHLFDVMGVEPFLGRTFLAQEDQPGGEKVVVLSYGLWQSLFAGTADVLGKTLRIDDNEHTIVGVMPPGFGYPDGAQLWTPLAQGRNSYPRSLHFLQIVARLEPGVSLASAQAEMTAIARKLEEQHPDSNEGRGLLVVPLLEEMTGEVRPALLVLFGAAGLVLLVACGNVANLLLSRMTERLREITVRQALGAGKARLTGQFLTEGLILAIAGGVLGVLLAVAVMKTLLTLIPQDIPRLGEVSIDGRVLGFTACIACLTALVFSLAPIFRLSKRNLSEGLREGERGGAALGVTGLRLRRILVVAEVAIALSLVISAGLLIRSFNSLRQIDPGFLPQSILTMEIALPWSKYTETHQTAGFFSELLDRIEALPGVSAVGAGWQLPLSELGGSTAFEIEGRPEAGPGQKTTAAVQAVSEGYFKTLGIPLRSGRIFTRHDDTEAPPVLIVNEAMARRFWPDEDPVGESVTFKIDYGPVGSAQSLTREVVGVVANFKNDTLVAPAEPEMYFPYRQAIWRMMAVAVRTKSEPLGLADALREQVWAVDQDQPVSQMRTMVNILSDATARSRFNMMLLGLFAGIALILAMVGVFGIISYSVSQRTHEIGLRMALGARQQDVIRQVLSHGMGLTIIGLVFGLLGALAGTRLLSGLLYEVTATDPVTFVVVALLSAAVALLASYLPARRATRIDPLEALRHE